MKKEALKPEEIILSVVTGSRLHGLNKPDSDWDIRGIFRHDPMDIISPFRNPSSVSWIEGDIDNTAYELRDFVKLLTQGNPNHLEVLYSNIVKQTSVIGEDMRANRIKFLDSERIYMAHKGYAANQFKKMNLWQPDERTPKFVVAYLRTMIQCIQLLETGSFSPQVEREKEFMLEVKFCPHEDFNEELRQCVWMKFNELETEAAQTYYKFSNQFKPDFEWIEELLECAYLKTPSLTERS